MGCKQLPPWFLASRQLQQPTFQEHYERLAVMAPTKATTPQEQLRVTISAQQMPLVQFCRWLSNEAGVSIVVEQRLDSQLLTVDVVDQTVSETLNVVARRLGVEVTQAGRLYFVGQLKPEDRGVLVRRVRRLSDEQLRNCLSVLRSDNGDAVAFPDGLVVVADRVEVLARVDDLLSQVEAADSATWVLQLHLVSLEDAALRDLGFDAVPALEVSATFAAASSTGITAAPLGLGSLRGGLDSILRSAHEDRRVQVVAQPMFLLGDGETSEHVRGQRVPIPKRAVSDQGTVTTQGFEYVQTGLVCKVSLREVRAESARLSLDVSMSDVVRLVENAPITREDRYTTTAEVQSGGVYLVGSLVRQSDNDKTLGGFQRRYAQDRSDTVLQVWAQAFRVGQPLMVENGTN